MYLPVLAVLLAKPVFSCEQGLKGLAAMWGIDPWQEAVVGIEQGMGECNLIPRQVRHMFQPAHFRNVHDGKGPVSLLPSLYLRSLSRASQNILVVGFGIATQSPRPRAGPEELEVYRPAIPTKFPITAWEGSGRSAWACSCRTHIHCRQESVEGMNQTWDWTGTSRTCV